MTSATDAAGRMKTFHYDAVGRLNAVKDDCGNLLETCEYGRKSLADGLTGCRKRIGNRCCIACGRS